MLYVELALCWGMKALAVFHLILPSPWLNKVKVSDQTEAVETMPWTAGTRRALCDTGRVSVGEQPRFI